MKESDFESMLAKYPDAIEDGLILVGRQVTVYGRRMDLLFEDRFKRKLIVELKAGPIKDEHIGQILSYEGMLISADSPDIRVMLIGTRVPPNIKKSLDHHGVAWKEITAPQIKEFLSSKGDGELMRKIDEEFLVLPNKIKGKQPSKVTAANSVNLREKIKIIENILSLVKQSNYSGSMVLGQALCKVQSGIREIIVTLRINRNNDFEIRIASLESEQSVRLATFFKEKKDSLNDLTKLTFCVRNESIRNPDRYKIVAEFRYDDGNSSEDYLNGIKNKYIEVVETFKNLWKEQFRSPY